MERRVEQWNPERICVLGSCAVFDFEFSEETFRSVREKGFDAVVFGYLDANWDGDFSRVDMYSESMHLPGILPHSRVMANRAELRRRLDLATAAGLKVYMSVRGPMTKTDLEKLNPEGAHLYHRLFGTGGDHWGGSGMEPFCLSEPRVRRHYLAMFQDIEETFPEIAGFMFFGGDSHCLVCDDHCPRCAGKPEWLRWGEWIDELYKDARSRNAPQRFDVMNWPWWDDMFDMVQHMDPGVGVTAITNWGFVYGSQSDGKYPSLMDEWECQEYQSDCLRVPVTDHGTAKGLTQGWFNAPVSASFERLVKICKEQGRRIVGWTELICSEAVWPYCMPSPATTVQRLEKLRELGVDGVFDLWGIDANILYNRRIDANATAFTTFFEMPGECSEAVLNSVARKLYGERGAEWAVKAWKEVDDALSHWAIIGYCQRMHWALRRLFPKLTCSFYVMNLTLDREADPNLHFIPAWPEFLLEAEIWDKLYDNLTGVIAGYDRALGCYDRLRADMDEDYADIAAFHQDCLLLGRTYHQIGLESCVYHAQGIRKRPLSREFMRSALMTRRLCRQLYTTLKVVPFETDGTDALLADMAEYADGK